MEQSIEKKTLIEVLNVCRLNELPKEWDGKRIWLKGVAKVVKCDNSRNYAVVENDGNNNAHIRRDFGNMARIVKVETIYPIMYLNENMRPDLRNKPDITNFLKNAGYDEKKIEMMLGDVDSEGNDKTAEQKKADKKQIKAWVDKECVLLQIEELHSRKL